MRNTLKQAVVLWGMVLLLVLWSVFISPSGVLRWAGAAAIVLAVAALLIYRRRQAWTEMTGDAGLSSLPPETYRQPVVLVCGDMSAHLFTDSPVRQVSEGLYLHVPDEEQLVAQVERLLTLRPAWASQLAVAYTVMPGMYRDAAVLTGRLRRFAHSMATVRRRAGVNVPWLLWSGLSGSPLPERANSPWFICTGGEIHVATSAETASPAQWLTQTSTQERSQQLCYLLKAESLMQWLNLNMLAALNGPETKCPPLAMAVGLVPSLPAVDNNLWQLWITARTGLTTDIADTGTDATLPFPDALLRRLTRQAWEGQVREAIEQVVTARREEIDWVLSDRQQDTSADISPDTLRNRLTSRYFTDFAGSWLAFLNSIRWKKEDSLSGILDQLTLMADARQSPLIALTDTLAWQAAAGRENRGLSDSLAKSAQELFNGKEKTPQQSREGDVPVGPLDKTFAPLLRLLGDKAGGGDSQLSLQTYLTRVTRVRLKLQQVTNAPDPQEMTQQLAQTVLQGKTVDLTDTRDYGRLIAASLGEEWSGFGQALFVRPVEQSWRQVLTPAADSLNRQWQRAIVSHWNQDFAGRYPFKASQNDASLPLLAQYLRDDGRINQFIAANLSGVLKREGRYWVADAMNTQGLTVNPDFIRALNRLRDVADTAFASGDAGIHFELRAKPARDVMKTHLVIDGQELEYFNQKERWQRFNWPDEQWQPGASLSWTSTQAMERILADYRGSWSLIRLLEQAQVTPVDSSTFKVVWKAQDGLPLNYLLRVEQGKGPLALLELKNFRLPGQVFLTGRSMKDAEEYGEDADE